MRHSRDGGNVPKIPLTGDVRTRPVTYVIPSDETLPMDSQDILAGRPERDTDVMNDVVPSSMLATERSIQFNPINRESNYDLKAKDFEPTQRILRDTLDVKIASGEERNVLFGKFKTGNKRKQKMRSVGIPQELPEIEVGEKTEVFGGIRANTRQNDHINQKIGRNPVDTGVKEKPFVQTHQKVQQPIVLQRDNPEYIPPQNRNPETIRRFAAMAFQKEYGRVMTDLDVELLSRGGSEDLKVQSGKRNDPRFQTTHPSLAARIQTDGVGTVFNSLPSIMHYKDFFRHENLVGREFLEEDRDEVGFKVRGQLKVRERGLAEEENVRFDKNRVDVEIGGRREVVRGKKKMVNGKTRAERDKDDVEVGRVVGGGKKEGRGIGGGRARTDRDRVETEVGRRTERSRAKKGVEAKPSQEKDREEISAKDSGIVFVSIDKMKDFTRTKSDVKAKVGRDKKEVGVEEGGGRKSVEVGKGGKKVAAVRERVGKGGGEDMGAESGSGLRFKPANKEKQSLQLAKAGTHDDIEFLPVGKMRQKAEVSEAKEKKHKIAAKTVAGKDTEVPLNDQKPPKTRSKLVPKQGFVEGEDDDDVRAQKVKPKKSTRNETKRVPVVAEGEEKDLKLSHPKQLFF